MNTISETEVLRFFENEADHPMSNREIISRMNIPAEERSSLRKLLRRMSKEGLLIKLKKGRFCLPAKMKLITGTVQGHPDGFGFLIPDEKGEEDLFISPKKMRTVLHGDKVICRKESGRDRKPEGSIVRIIERGTQKLVGIFDRTPHFAYLVPFERRVAWDIPIPNKFTMDAKRGQAVVVEITQYPTKNLPPEGKVIEILGKPDDPRIEMEMIIRKNNLPRHFQREVLQEAERTPSEIDKEEIKRRLDLRDRTVFTIDGESAKDFDDAVSIERKKDGGFQLGVHIADVSHYVKPGTALDKEALERGVSVYFPDKVIPMFPERLSNGICSLVPEEERLTLSCFMDFDSKGNRVDYHIRDSVIKSAYRFTYTRVANILEPKETSDSVNGVPEAALQDIHVMKELALLLNKNRFKNGSVDFDLPEPDIILDMEGKIENIVLAERNIAHKIIEEFMLSANIAVAEFLENSKIKAIYRIHETPGHDKLTALKEFIHNFGYTIPQPSEFTSKDLQGVLSKAAGCPEEKLINHIALRSMKQAVYSPENTGHFCLAFPCYTHFTSPIRRYPDLVVHRLIRSIQQQKNKEKKPTVTTKTLNEVAKLCSELERRAEGAEREVLNLKKIEFMSDKIGEAYEGFITGVTSYGLFVELADLFVEGLVHVSSMNDDYYIYHEKQHALMGERKKKVFRLGDRIAVRVSKVSRELQRIDFEIT